MKVTEQKYHELVKSGLLDTPEYNVYTLNVLHRDNCIIHRRGEGCTCTPAPDYELLRANE